MKNLNNLIFEIEKNLDSIKDELHKLEKINQIEKEKNDDYIKTERAKKYKFMYSLFAKGLSSWAVAEKMEGYFSSVWDAYYFVTNERRHEKAREKFARSYLIKALSDYGFKNTEISKISGYTPQRCGQIIAESHF